MRRKISKEVDSGETKKTKTQPGTYNHSSLHSAISRKSNRSIDRFLVTDIPCTDDNPNCFFLAQKTGDWDIVMKLLQRNPAGVNARGPDGETLLLRYITDSDKLQYLLNLGADPHLCLTSYMDNAFLRAVNSNAPLEVLQILADLNVDPNMRDENGRTPLILAVKRYKDSVDGLIKIQTLLHAGANTSVQDKYGLSALHHAMFVISDEPFFANKITKSKFKKYYLPMLQLLLDHGSKLYAQDKSSLAVIHYAFIWYKKHNLGPDVLKFLLKFAIKYANNMPISKDAIFHPHRLLLIYFNDIYGKGDLYNIATIIFKSPLKELSMVCPSVFCHLKCYAPRRMVFDTIGCFTSRLKNNPTELHNWLLKLLDCGFSMNSIEPDYISPLTIYMESFHLCKRTDDFDTRLAIIKLFINKGVDVTQRRLHLMSSHLYAYSNELKLLDVLLLAVEYIVEECLHLVLPYWPVHPLALMLFMDPWSHRPIYWHDTPIPIMATRIFPVLVKLGGPLPPSSKLHCLIENHLDVLADTYHECEDIWNRFKDMHRSPPSLLLLSRNAVRNCVTGSNDLPERLAKLVPPGLKAFITLREEVYNI